jgi:hypothetical protein
MEAIGAASSLFTLIQVVNTIAKQGRNIISRYKHAPAQLHRVTNLVTIVHSQLTIISHLQKDIAETHHPLLPDDVASLNHVLKIVAVSFDTIQKGLESQCTKSGIRARLQWALWDHTKSADLELRLQHDENRLHTVLQLISV